MSTSNAQLIITARQEHLRVRGNAQGPITADDHRAFADAVIEAVENLDNKPSGEDAFLFATGSGEPDANVGRTDTVVLNTESGDIWQKQADGTWRLQFTIPTTGGGGGTFPANEPAAATAVGNMPVGFELASKEVLAVVRQMASAVETFPSYAPPSAGIGSSQTGLVKRGTTVAPGISTSFSQGDAGALNSYTLTRGTTTLASDTTPPIDHPNFTDSYVIGEESVAYAVAFGYGQGPQKQSSQGNPAPGRIPAGTVTASFTLTGIMPWYYGTSDTDTAPNVYGGTEVIAASNGALQVPSFGAGSKWLWFAVPRTAGGASQKAFSTWYRTALDNGAIGGGANLFRSPVTVSVTSSGLAANWTRDYDLYFSNYPTAAGTATTLN